jgi:hypothetical protein
MTIDELAAEYAALLDASAHDTTREALDALVARRVDLERRLGTAYTAQTTLDALGSDDDEKWRDLLTTARARFCEERMEIKSPIRDRELKHRAEILEFSIRLIDRGLASSIGALEDLSSLPIGDLLLAAGYEVKVPELHGPRGWRGSLPAVEKRLAQRAAEERAARATLAEALMSDEERAAREVEAKAYRDTYNRLNLRHSLDATTLIAFRDGRVLPVNEMTETERAVFEQANAAFAAS